MTTAELRRMYIEFFREKGHTQIQCASIIPEDDSTILFCPAGMQPLVPYLLGEKHPSGTRLVNFQKCIRTGDIEEVGDRTHLTYFEMLGNWSLGDYGKREAISWSYEFLTSEKWLGLDSSKLYVTVFAGDDKAPADEASKQIWLETGIPLERIYALGRQDNWWGPIGNTGPCGPDTEMFMDTGLDTCSDECRPGCNCGKYFEIWNDVFMEYRKTETGEFTPLEVKNVDTGMGVERTVAMLNGKDSVFDIPLFHALLVAIQELAGCNEKPDEDRLRSIRIIADHIRTAAHILGDDMGIPPSNLDRGYVLRRLIRLAVRHGIKLGIRMPFTKRIAEVVIKSEAEAYPELARNRSFVLDELEAEEIRFERTLSEGLKEFNKLLPNLLKNPKKTIPGRVAFRLYDTYGFPVEFTSELANENGMTVDMDGFTKAFEKHKELSRKGSEQKFSGGLADNSEMVTKLHTATHLLHQALRNILGRHVEQKGSNITEKRLRFDFSHPAKMTDEEKKQVEEEVNRIIKEGARITSAEMSLDEAIELGAIGLFKSKYGEKVKVYRIGDYSIEICGGPHVENTSELGTFMIKKEQSSSQGIRRIKAVLS